MPYLTVYVVYAAMNWQVNPCSTDEPFRLTSPCLLHVFWFIHGLHIATAAALVRSSYRTRHSAYIGLSGYLWPATPWVSLALFYYLPGLYLEYPADSWEHLARITRWLDYAELRQCPTWAKSSYFLAYSLMPQHAPIGVKLEILRIYYTLFCVLLSWQYYRLARTIELPVPYAWVFVVAAGITLGNNTFSFHRYYGLSSTLPAHIASIALITYVVELLKRTQTRFFDVVSSRSTAADCVAVVCLLMLISFNHPQGIGISALGIAAATGWRLMKWNSRATWMIVAAVLVGSVAMAIFWTVPESFESQLRPMGWLSRWYGFTIFDPSSPAGQRALEVLGFGGIASIMAAILLVRKNHVGAWLTIVPVLALCVPAVSIPLASVLAEDGDVQPRIITFSRVLFAVPTGLTLVVLAFAWASEVPRVNCRRGRVTAAACVALLAAILASPEEPLYGKLWNTLAVPPNDLAMHHELARAADHAGGAAPHNGVLVSTHAVGFVWFATSSQSVADFLQVRPVLPFYSPAAAMSRVQLIIKSLQLNRHEAHLIAVPDSHALYSQYSQAGILSGHWSPHQVALEHMGAVEIKTATAPYAITSKQPHGLRIIAASDHP